MNKGSHFILGLSWLTSFLLKKKKLRYQNVQWEAGQNKRLDQSNLVIDDQRSEVLSIHILALFLALKTNCIKVKSHY